MRPSGALSRLLALDRALSSRCLIDPVESPRAYRLAALLAHAGDGVLVTILGAALWFVIPHERAGLWQAASGVLLSAVLVAAAKYAVRRERPLGEASARWSADPKHDVYSFPSGHAARVACLAIWSACVWPGATPWLVLWALLVGAARVAVGAHHWLDVLAGWILGAVVAAALVVIVGVAG